jgi:predicted nucleic-acid-binding protein
MRFLDANMILRYLLNDDDAQSPLAKEIIENGGTGVPLEVLPEVVYVLSGSYKVSREEIRRALGALLSSPEISIERTESVMKALELYGTTNLDIVDCLLAARAVVDGDDIHTFDKQLNKLLKEATAIRPE